MKLAVRLVVFTTCLLGLPSLGGCAAEGPGAEADAGVDRGPVCNPDFGQSYVIDTMALNPTDEGADLDGDGTPDNALGIVGPFVNGPMEETLVNGAAIFVLDVLDWTDPPTPDDDSLGLVLYQALDADVPEDPTDNLSGSGEFYALASQFDVACQPTSTFDEAALAERVLAAYADRFAWVAPGTGTVEIVHLTFSATFDEGYAGFAFGLTGIVELCSLAKTPSDYVAGGTLLDLVLEGVHVDPDIDMDGDGLEQVVSDASGVVECIDGDGTHIPGTGCPCDPRIADGYSVAMNGTAVRARLVGVIDQ